MLFKLLIISVAVVAVTQSETPEVMTKCVIDAFLKVHNEARANVSVPPLVWSDKLSSYASDWSARCKFEHSHGDFGENIFATSASTKNIRTAQDAVEAWNSEIVNVDLPDWECFGRSEDNCGHYSQVVWRNTKRVGCGITHCESSSWIFVVCSYDPPGNYMGEKAY